MDQKPNSIRPMPSPSIGGSERGRCSGDLDLARVVALSILQTDYRSVNYSPSVMYILSFSISFVEFTTFSSLHHGRDGALSYPKLLITSTPTICRSLRNLQSRLDFLHVP